MKLRNYVVIGASVFVTIFSCNKPERPALGDYPKDTNPPGGPLKFYSAFDGSSVDSIKANYGTDKNVSFVDGVSGKAVQGDATGYVVFPSANDFKTSKNFTVAFWIKKDGPNASGTGTAFTFGLSTGTGIWTDMDMFLEFEDAGNPSTADSAACKFYMKDQWFEFTKTSTVDKRLSKVLDNQWHQLAFVFDSTTATMTPYVDGSAYTNLPAGFGKFNNNGGVVDFSQSAGVVIGGPGHYANGKTPDSWMGNFNGAIDQFRLYGTALSAADIAALYNSKL